MPPNFLYFDLGNVLLRFCVDRMCRQMGEAAQTDPETIRRIVFAEGLETAYEQGRLTRDGFYEGLCRALKKRPDCDAMRRASEDIFWLDARIVPLVAQLHEAGYRLGILSNTCEGHWEHCRERFRLIDELFAVHALSYRIGAMKPTAEIFAAAAELAGEAPQEIFFVDDLAGHVAGARAAGFDAVQFVGVSPLAAELRRRGLEFNY